MGTAEFYLCLCAATRSAKGQQCKPIDDGADDAGGGRRRQAAAAASDRDRSCESEKKKNGSSSTKALEKEDLIFFMYKIYFRSVLQFYIIIYVAIICNI